MNKLDIRLKDEDFEDRIANDSLIPIKAFYNPVNWESNIHLIYEDDNRDIEEVISWFNSIAKKHNATIVYYDLKVFEKSNYLINKDDILNFTIDNDLNISDEILDQFMGVIDEYNSMISKKEEGVVDTYILYFLHEGKVISYFMKNEDLSSVDDVLDDIIESIGEELDKQPSEFIN